MDFTQILDSLEQQLAGSLPSILAAVAVLIVGWLLAVGVRALVRKTFGFAKVNERIRTTTGESVDIEGAAASIVYWLILLVAIIGFFNVLDLQQVSTSLQSLVDQILAYAPKLVAGSILLLIAWVLATIVRSLIRKLLGSTKLDEKLTAGAGMKPMSETLANVMYWIVMLLFLPAILDALAMTGLLGPVQGMVNEFLTVLPDIVGALAIALVGWLLARILRDLVGSLLAAAGADGVGERIGLEGTLTLSRLIALVVYVLVLVPALIAALDALAIEAISAPATEMLSALMAAIPNIFGAALILFVAWLVSGFAASIVTSLLGGMGFDKVPERLGLWKAEEAGGLTASEFVGRVIVFFVMLFASVEAAGRLGFDQMSSIVATMIDFGGQVLLGVVIIGVGLWLSQLAHRAISMPSAQGANRNTMAGIVRFAIIGIVIAMGLRAMGLADDIVNLAFGLTLGAIAVAVALSFGLGGREAAGKQMEHWFHRMRNP